MKIKLDENIPARLTSILGRLGHEVDTVNSEGLAGRDYIAIWEGAQRTNRFLITQDLDFQTYVGISLAATTVSFWYDCGIPAVTSFCEKFKRYLSLKK